MLGNLTTALTREGNVTIMTNEVSGVGLSNQGVTIIRDVLAFVVPIITATLLALWRNAARRSELQTTLTEALIRGIEMGSKNISDSDTKVVKRAVQAEAAEAGVACHLEKVVEKVKSQNGNGRNGKNGDH